jgi:hypothetical protein
MSADVIDLELEREVRGRISGYFADGAPIYHVNNAEELGQVLDFELGRARRADAMRYFVLAAVVLAIAWTWPR